MGILGKAANAVGQTMGKLSSKVMPVIGGFSTLNKFLTGTIQEFANVGDSVEKAAATIPILGGLFSAVAGAAVKVNDAFLTATKSGATFGGSVSNMAAAASAAGMTMDKFGALIARNGQGMLAFGGTTEEGSKRFAQVSKSLRATSGDLYALGYSTEDINQGLASYGALMRAQGLQGRQSNAQLVDGAKKYLKELDSLAKITGEERSVKEAEMKRLASDAQFQAAMAGKDENVRNSFMKTVTSLPAPLQGFVKDFLATGTLTSEETQRIGAMMGGEVMNELQSMRNKMQAGQALTAQEQDRLAAIMKSAAEKQLKATGTALAASREMDGATNAMASALTLNTNAHQNAAKEQNKAAKEGDGFNKRMQQMQQTLAQFSNAFQMALANSGVLDLMMKMFSSLANLVMNFVVPAFNIFANIITSVGNFLMTNIQPVFQAIGDFIGRVLYPAFLQLAAFIMIDVVPKLQELGTMITSFINPIFEYLGSVIQEYVYPAFESVSAFISDNLVPIFYGLAASLALYGSYLTITKGLELAKIGITTLQNAMQIAATMGLTGLAGAAWSAALPFIKIAAPIILLVGLFKLLYDNGWTLSTAWEAMKDNLTRMGLALLDFVDSIRAKLPEALGGLSKDEAEARKKEREETKKLLDDREKARDQQRKQVADERAAGVDKQKREDAAKKLDAQIMSHKQKFGAGIGKTADKVQEANRTLDYGAGPEALLKQFGMKENSKYAIDAKKEEFNKEKEAAEKQLTEAKTTAERRAAIDKIEAAEKKLSDLDKLAKGEAVPKTTEREASGTGESTRRQIESDAERRRQDEEKAQETKNEASRGRGQQPTQESAESLLVQLNTNVQRLIKINQEQKDIGERQLTVQRSMTKDLFAAV